MAYGYGYGGYPGPGGYVAPPMPDQLAQLRQQQFPAQQPIMQQPMHPVQAQQQPTNNGIIWCQGEEGAKAWIVNPGATVMLMDSDGSSFYLKSADASGMPLPLRIFDYTERKSEKQTENAAQSPTVEYVTVERFNELAARYEAIVQELDALKNKANKNKKTKEDED